MYQRCSQQKSENKLVRVDASAQDMNWPSTSIPFLTSIMEQEEERRIWLERASHGWVRSQESSLWTNLFQCSGMTLVTNHLIKTISQDNLNNVMTQQLNKRFEPWSIDNILKMHFVLKTKNCRENSKKSIMQQQQNEFERSKNIQMLAKFRNTYISLIQPLLL